MSPKALFTKNDRQSVKLYPQIRTVARLFRYLRTHSECTVIIFGYNFSQLPGFHFLCRRQDAPRKTGNKFPFSPGFHYLCRWIEDGRAIFACKPARLLSPFTIFAEDRRRFGNLRVQARTIALTFHYLCGGKVNYFSRHDG